MRAAVLALGLLLSALAAAAADPAEPWGYDLAHELMSPYCPGRALAECPSEAADRLRQWILAQEASGASRDEVVARLEAEYGDRIHQAPPAEGVGLVAYAIPVATLLLGGGLVVVFLRRQGGGARAEGHAPAPGDAELERRLDAELRGS